MELIFILAFVCVFGAVSIGIAALIFFIVRHSQRRVERLVKIGDSLGLASEGAGRIGGLRGGVRVSVRHVTEGSGDNSSSWTYVEAEIDPPLRLGLNVRRKGWLGVAWSELFGSGDVPVGIPAFDASFAVDAVEREEVPRLFDPVMVAALMGAHATSQRLWISDDRVHTSFSGFSTDVGKITFHLDSMIHLARTARVARRRMGPTAREREVVASWGGLAGEAGFRFDPDTLVLSGTSGRHRFTIAPTLDQTGWSTRFRVAYDRPLGVALIVQKERALAAVGRLFGMRDIEVGDQRFDDTFRVKGTDETAVRHILGDSTLRDRILSLFTAARSFEIHDDCVDAVARGLTTDAAGLTQSLEKVVAIAEGLRARVDAPSGGAYR